MWQNLCLLLCLFAFHVHARPAEIAPETVPARHRFLLITGTPHSGLGYTARLLYREGLHVTHERSLGQDGIASWLFATPGRKAPRGPIPYTVTFDHVFHQVRHPLKVIAALNYNPSKDAYKLDEYVFQNIPEISRDDLPFVRNAKLWYYWNLKAEECAEWTYRVEEIESAFFEMEERLRLFFNPSTIDDHPFIDLSKAYTWKQLEERLRFCGNKKLIHKIKELAAHYGYDIED